MTGTTLDDPGGNRVPTYQRDQGAIWKEIHKLWARVNEKHRNASTLDVPFVYPGRLATTRSPRYYVNQGGRVRIVRASLDTPGTTETKVKIYRNGDPVDTLTFAPGEVVAVSNPQVAFSGDIDYCQVGITEVGDNAQDLCVQVRFIQRAQLKR